MSDFYSEKNLSGLKRDNFKRKISGKKTDLFILSNNKGCEIAATNYAGALLSIMVPDKYGNFANVIQGHDSIDNVINSPEIYLNTLIGRYGNRIAKGEFVLDGKKYSLATNDAPNHLHGGPSGFHKVVWDAEQTDKQTLKLHYLSVDGEEGYPGNLDVNVTYKLTDENELLIEYEAVTDKKTIINLTQHAYFNLAGIRHNTPVILDNILIVNADHYLPIDNKGIPSGRIEHVENTAFDFRTPHRIGERIDDSSQQTKNGFGYDHCWVLNKREPEELSLAVKCIEPDSGRTLECFTTEPGIQVYTANHNSGCAGAHGATFPKRSAVCFEAQHLPDSPNKAFYPPVWLAPGQLYTQTTIYRFGIE